MEYQQFRNEMEKKDAIIEAQARRLGMLEMATQVKKKINHFPPAQYAYLCSVLDDIWKAEMMNVEAIEHLNS